MPPSAGSEPPYAVGRIERITRSGKAIVASGFTQMSPGFYTVGLDVGDAEWHHLDDGTICLTAGVIWAATVDQGDPAWPDCVIEVFDR